MTKEQHPITLSLKQIKQWAPCKGNSSQYALWHHIATQAAIWAADQELEACVNYVDNNMSGNKARELRAIRRPKPPTMKEQALNILQYPKDFWSDSEVDTIRRALETLPND